MVSGEDPSALTAKVESYDGTNWTEGPDVSTSQRVGGGNGSQTAALKYGGFPGTVNTESWDGSSWSEVGNLSTPHGYTSGC